VLFVHFLHTTFPGSGFSFYVNTIVNENTISKCSIEFEVQIGTTANFYIPHTEILFNDMSNYLNLTINDKSYGQTVSLTK
jgi:hypothetical protein